MNNFNNVDVITKAIRFCSKKFNQSNMFDYYKSGAYFDYITRDEAALKFDFDSLNNYEFKTHKEILNLKNNSDQSKNKSGLYDKNGKQLTLLEYQSMKNNFKNKFSDNQFFWDYVVSFSKESLERNTILDPKKILEVLNPKIERFLEFNKFDKSKVDYYLSFHVNKENNIHVHLGFFENEPQFLNGGHKKNNPKLVFKQKGLLNGLDNRKWAYMIDVSLNKLKNYETLRMLRSNYFNKLKDNLLIVNDEFQNPILNLKKDYDNLFLLLHNKKDLKINKKIIDDLSIKLAKDLWTKTSIFTIEKNEIINFLKETQKNLDEKAKVYNTQDNFLEQQLEGKFGLINRIATIIKKVIKKQIYLEKLEKKLNINKKIKRNLNSFEFKQKNLMNNRFNKFLYLLNKNYYEEEKLKKEIINKHKDALKEIENWEEEFEGEY